VTSTPTASSATADRAPADQAGAVTAGDQATTRSRRARGTNRWTMPLGSLLIAAVAVLIWWLFSLAYFIVPSPSATVRALVTSFDDPKFLVNLQSTAVAAVLAIAVSIVAGVLIGLALGLVPWISRGFEPLIVAANGLPKIVLYPVLLLMLGMGTQSKVALGAIIGVFPVMMNVAAGIRDMPPIYRRLARSLQASRWQMFWQIILPAIRRPAMVGIRLATSLSAVGVVLAEMFATQYGLGRVILAAHTAGQYPLMLATVLLLIFVAFLLTMLLWRIERRMR
jgi:NitT/TauT family transport system permease protein